MCEEYNSPTK